MKKWVDFPHQKKYVLKKEARLELKPVIDTFLATRSLQLCQSPLQYIHLTNSQAIRKILSNTRSPNPTNHFFCH